MVVEDDEAAAGEDDDPDVDAAAEALEEEGSERDISVRRFSDSREARAVTRVSRGSRCWYNITVNT